ncbi:MAG: ArsC family transcriptional regulator [Oscillospiraceae bacterium]|nr:ArsC family transcriptional regulator [Oscillospiraceae bacterium]
MNIQIFGTAKSFDTKKAERFFKERNIKYQYIDMKRYGISRGELQSVKNAFGLENLIDTTKEDSVILKYLNGEEERFQKLYENQDWIKLPIVRNGKAATVGYEPDVWKDWK